MDLTGRTAKRLFFKLLPVFFLVLTLVASSGSAQAVSLLMGPPSPLRALLSFRGLYGSTTFILTLLAVAVSVAMTTGANFDGARLSQRTKFPEGFDLTKHKFVPTSRLNEDSSPWRASDKGLENSMVESYKPPDLAIPDFPGWDFSKLDYTAAWLPGSDMRGAKMSFTNWSASNLAKANLSGVEATGAIFYDTVLNDADLTSANLFGADFRRSNLTGAKLDKAILTNALYNQHTVWPEGFDPKLAGAYFSDKCANPYTCN